MSKTKYSKLITVILFSLFFLFTSNVYASNYYTTITLNIGESYNSDFSTKNDNTGSTFKMGDYTFDNLLFINDKSERKFGLTGKIINNQNTNTSKYYMVKVYYCDNDTKTLSNFPKELTLTSGENNLDLLNSYDDVKYNPSDIKYYRLEFKVLDTEEELSYYMSEDEIRESTYQSKRQEEVQSSSANNEQDQNDYVIDKYNVDMVVNDDNTFDITERISAYFYKPKHGIIRKLPIRNSIRRNDGTTDRNRVKITDLTVNYPYTKSINGDDLNIQIGDPDKTIYGSKEYIIKYKYNIGKDPLEDVDEFYYNIIGTEWDTYINDASFEIKMPKEFDQSKLGFSNGPRGAIGYSNIDYRVDGNTIIGKYNGTLRPHEGITVRLTLPEGHFVRKEFDLDIDKFSNVVLIVFPILFLIISVALWYKYGKDEKIVETVEFYPPDGLNSLDTAFMYKGSVDRNDVTSLLIYLANKGYLKIEELKDDGKLDFYDTIKITKLKDYDGQDENEKLFLEGLFEKGTSVTMSDLCDTFYLTTFKIETNVNTKKNKRKIFLNTTGKSVFIGILIAVIFFLITFIPFYEEKIMKNFIIGLIFPSLGYALIVYSIFFEKGSISINGNLLQLRFNKIFFGGAFGLYLGGFVFSNYVWPVLRLDEMYIISYIVGLICIVFMTICSVYMLKRNQYGTQILGKIKGFKTFLETAEKDKLEALVNENPTYFYDILPYTYVLGISDKWINKFEAINMPAPNWYSSYDSFDTHRFSVFIDNTMYAM